MWEKEPVASRAEAMIEWFFGQDSAFAFIVSFEQHSPVNKKKTRLIPTNRQGCV